MLIVNKTGKKKREIFQTNAIFDGFVVKKPLFEVKYLFWHILLFFCCGYTDQLPPTNQLGQLV